MIMRHSHGPLVSFPGHRAKFGVVRASGRGNPRPGEELRVEEEEPEGTCNYESQAGWINLDRDPG